MSIFDANKNWLVKRGESGSYILLQIVNIVHNNIYQENLDVFITWCFAGTAEN